MSRPEQQSRAEQWSRAGQRRRAGLGDAAPRQSPEGDLFSTSINGEVLITAPPLSGNSVIFGSPLFFILPSFFEKLRQPLDYKDLHSVSSHRDLSPRPLAEDLPRSAAPPQTA